jgi:hypothetical protein
MTLLLQVNGDIASRIVALLSGICWAEELQTSLEVYWWFMPNIRHCSFDRLFLSSSLPSWVTVKPGYIEHAVKIYSEEDFIEKKYPLVIQSKAKFYEKNSEKWLHYLRSLRPAFHLQSKITMIPCVNTVGIYEHQCNESRMSQVLSVIWKQFRSSHHYLVSTDSEETKRFSQIMFKSNVYFIDGTLSTHNDLYLFNQIIHFFCFSKCIAILDSSDSLLMRLAAMYGNIEHIPISLESPELFGAASPSTP